MLVRASIKRKSPFDQSAYQGSGPLVHPRKSLWDMRKPRIWLLHRPDFPRHRRGYMPARPDELRSVLHTEPTPKIFTVMVPPPNMGYGLFNFGRNLNYHPHHLPRLAGEIGRGRYKCTCTFPKNCPGIPPMIERSTQDVSFPVFPENSHHSSSQHTSM